MGTRAAARSPDKGGGSAADGPQLFERLNKEAFVSAVCADAHAHLESRVIGERPCQDLSFVPGLCNLNKDCALC